MLSRNLYILAATLGFFALVAYVIGFSGIAHEPGAPQDASLWHMIGIILLLLGLVVTLFGVFQSMFEQAERRSARQAGQDRAKSPRRSDGGPVR
ncbi:hypothetical protein [Terriglobus aquaticus]|uniref:Uncharacterized protein n=1 Tax=Terriglobus aquaticus TaxID=940139 RepID=A0ABW9KNL3_9BACT|nr:hypothetical protein [Terriglobus aquaticus]